EFLPTGLPDAWKVERTAPRGGFVDGFVCTDGSYAGGRLACNALSGAIAWSVAPPGRAGVTVETTMGDDRAVLEAARQLGPLARTTVRGHSAEIVKTSQATGLTWLEHPGVRVSMFVPAGAGVDAMTIADGLRATAVPLAR